MTNSSGRMRSVEASRAIWKTKVKLTTSELIVAQAIASHADANFECHPGRNRLAEMTHLSKRQVLRIVRRLREKGVLSFEDNPGGSHEATTRYRLLISPTGDILGGTGDNCTGANTATGDASVTGDKSETGDKSSMSRVTNLTSRVTKQAVTGDTAMSPKGFEGFEGGKAIGGKPALFPERENQNQVLEEWLDGIREQEVIRNLVPRFSPLDHVFEELGEPQQRIDVILSKGIPVTRDEICTDHGPFVRRGWLWQDWVVWEGEYIILASGRNFSVGGGYSPDAGCAGCRAEHEQFIVGRDREMSPVRRFDLRIPAICKTHGEIVYQGTVTEYSAKYEEVVGERWRPSDRWVDGCPYCEADMDTRDDLMDCLGLSDDEWERGEDRILDAIAFARCGDSEPV